MKDKKQPKEAPEVWYGGPYDGTDNPPTAADGMVKCVETGESLFIFECFDQYHFYKLARQQHKKSNRRRYMWTHAGIVPQEQWDEWVKEWKMSEQELHDHVYDFLKDELDQEEEDESSE